MLALIQLDAMEGMLTLADTLPRDAAAFFATETLPPGILLPWLADITSFVAYHLGPNTPASGRLPCPTPRCAALHPAVPCCGARCAILAQLCLAVVGSA